MKRFEIIAWCLLILASLWIFTIKSNSDSDENTTHTINVSAFISELEKESINLFNEVYPVSFKSKSAETANSFRKKNWFFLQYDQDKLTYWNSNKLSFDSVVRLQSNFPLFYDFGDDLYCVFNHQDESYLFFRIANDGVFHPRISEYYPELENAVLTQNVNRERDNSNISELSYKKGETTRINYLWIGLLISFSILLLGLFYLVKASKENTKATILLWLANALMILISIRLLKLSSLSIDEFYFLKDNSLQLLSNSVVMLLLFIHLFGLSLLLLSLINLINRLPRLVAHLISATAIFFFADFVIDLGGNISGRSNISFDFEKLFALSSYSFVSIAYISAAFAVLWLLIFYCNLREYINQWSTWLVICISAILFVGFQYFDSNRDLVNLIQPVALVLVSLILIRLFSFSQRQIYIHFIITAFLVSWIVHSSQESRENDRVAEYASMLIGNKDERTERILKSIENQLAQEFLVPEDYQNFVIKKDNIESRIKQLYFSNYLEKYELKLLSFDPEGKNINQNVIYNYDDLNEVYNNNTKRTSSDYFYQIDNPITFNGYIAKYENCDIDGHFGTTFIILQPRVVQSEFLYPEVFANQQTDEIVNLDDFSYGIYFNNQLISQKGSYSYQLNKIPTSNTDNIWYLGEVHHRVFPENKYTVVISKSENTLKSWFSSFTFTLILLYVVCFVFSVIARIYKGPRFALARAFIPGASKYISSRIQTSLTILLLAALLLSVYIIISYIRSNYNQTLENQLLVKIKNISTQVQNKVDLSKKLSNEEQRTLILNEQSSTYKVDINLYNQQGQLLSSTKPYLTENEILGSQMNPKAYTQLSLTLASQLLQQEELEGSDYLSAYVPLFDGKNNVIGYLNTPYFAKNEELSKQISSLVVNILNIYFLLLLAGVLIAFIISKQISKPLLIIREKIAKTALRGQNELIIYERDDEIGRLVKQYNKMVLELEESANQMAETEREDAWREMAKQVAHEIKNPLTPMKLSIQHLQRAFESGPSEKLNKLFAKTSKLLIDQINSLSNMASEFSNFAKMPEDNYVDFDVSKSLKSTIDLFLRSENISIRRQITDDVWINADPEQIKRVFNNLIKNAIQATPEGKNGLIEISLKKVKSEAIISVKDNGIGIPKENYRKVFVPNFSTKNSGMGLGLAITRKIIESAKGKIQFKSEVGKGTTFVINLPAIEK